MDQLLSTPNPHVGQRLLMTTLMRTSFQELDHILPTEYQRTDIVFVVYKESSLKVEHDPKGGKRI